jgi:hypothetical protein
MTTESPFVLRQALKRAYESKGLTWDEKAVRQTLDTVPSDADVFEVALPNGEKLLFFNPDRVGQGTLDAEMDKQGYTREGNR